MDGISDYLLLNPYDRRKSISSSISIRTLLFMSDPETLIHYPFPNAAYYRNTIIARQFEMAALKEACSDHFLPTLCYIILAQLCLKVVLLLHVVKSAKL